MPPFGGHGHGGRHKHQQDESAQAQLREVLLSEGDKTKEGIHADLEAALAQTSLTIAGQKRWIFVTLILDVASFSAILFGGDCGMKTSASGLFHGDLQTMLGDVITAVILRWILCTLFLIVVRRGKYPLLASLFWWSNFSLMTLLVCKAIIFPWTSMEVIYQWRGVFVGVTLFFAIIEVLFLLRLDRECQRALSIDKWMSVADGTSDRGKAEGEDEDPRSRFFEDPDKKLESLLRPQHGCFGLKFGFLQVMKPYFWPRGLLNKIRTIGTLFLMGGSKVCGIYSPLYIGYAVQTLSDEKVVPYRELIIYVTLSFSVYALSQLQRVVYLGVKQQAFAEIAETTFRHLHSLSIDWHLQKKMGAVLRIMDRGIMSANSVMNYLVLYLIPSVAQALATFIIFYIKFKSPELTAVAFLSFVIYCVLTIKITTWRKKFRKKTNKQDNKYHDLATDSLINFETVKYFANEEYETANFKEAVLSYQKYSVSTQASLALLNTTQQLDVQITTLIALCISATTILHLTSTDPASQIGDFVSVNAYIVGLFAPLSFLGTIYSTVIQAFIDMTNLAELLVLSPDVMDSKDARAITLKSPQKGASIEFRNVSFRYPSQSSKGVKNISFYAPPGSTTAIVGPTGGGKSTLFRLLFRFYDTDSGDILIDDQRISNVTQRSLRKSIGVVPQDPVLFNKSIKENIQYGDVNASFEAVQEAAENAQITNFIASLDKSWDTAVGERGLKISGGEKQRVAIARCLLKDPPVVLFDEATSALDSATEIAIQEALNRLGKGRTQVIIAHRLSTIANASQILVMENGRIAERGTHTELLDAKGVYFDLWTAQSQSTNNP